MDINDFAFVSKSESWSLIKMHLYQLSIIMKTLHSYKSVNQLPTSVFNSIFNYSFFYLKFLFEILRANRMIHL